MVEIGLLDQDVTSSAKTAKSSFTDLQLLLILLNRAKITPEKKTFLNGAAWK